MKLTKSTQNVFKNSSEISQTEQRNVQNDCESFSDQVGFMFVLRWSPDVWAEPDQFRESEHFDISVMFPWFLSASSLCRFRLTDMNLTES